MWKFRKLPPQLLLPLRSVVRLHLLSHCPVLSHSEDANYISCHAQKCSSRRRRDHLHKGFGNPAGATARVPTYICKWVMSTYCMSTYCKSAMLTGAKTKLDGHTLECVCRQELTRIDHFSSSISCPCVLFLYPFYMLFSITVFSMCVCSFKTDRVCFFAICISRSAVCQTH